MSKVIYIAGPYRGPHAWAIEENIREAERLSLEVWRMGLVALCPHTNTRHFQGALPDDVWLHGDLLLLDRCDALLTTIRWHESSGARTEVEYARAKGMPVFHTLVDLLTWTRESVLA